MSGSPSGRAEEGASPSRSRNRLRVFLHHLQDTLRDARHVGRRHHVGVEQQVHAERPVGEALHLADARADFIGRKVRAAQDAQAAGTAHRRRERRAGDASHARLQDRVLDAEEVAQGSAQAWRLLGRRGRQPPRPTVTAAVAVAPVFRKSRRFHEGIMGIVPSFRGE